MYQVQDVDFKKVSDENKSKNFVLNLDLNGFNGPLDLLLQLAQTKKLDITKISILVFNKFSNSFFISFEQNKPFSTNFVILLNNLLYFSIYF